MDYKTALELIRDIVASRGDFGILLDRYKRTTQHTLVTVKNWKYHVTTDDIKFLSTTDIYTVDDIIRDYRINDIKPNDVVLDIGANIGGFTLRAAKKARCVHSYEPVRHEELLENIHFNNINNVIVHPSALGDGKPINIRWQGDETMGPRDMVSINVNTVVFPDMPRCDWLKCDAEGSEWTISPEQLADVRRIEMEMHTFDNYYRPFPKRKYDEWLRELKKTHDCEVSILPHQDVYGILHAELK